VNLFFAISGFLLVPGLVRTTQPRYWRFVVKRLKRLVPLYYLVGFASALALTIAGRPPTVGAVISYVLFASIYTGSFIFGSAWTLNVEIAFVALSVPVAWVLRSNASFHRQRAPLLLVIGLGAYVASEVVLAALNGLGELKVAPIANLLPFLAGGALGSAADGRQTPPSPTQSAALLLVAIATWTAIVFGVVPRFIWLPLATAGSLALIYSLRLRRLPGARAGRFSYGLYLWHLPIIQVFLLAAYGGLHPGWRLSQSAVFTGCVAAVALAMAVVSYRWFERPIMDVRTHGEADVQAAEEAYRPR